MDDNPPEPDWIEIIMQLRLEAGRIMEDASIDLTRNLPAVEQARDVQLGKDCEAAGDIHALLAAARVLHRRCIGG
jgi:hypothetical protein